MTESSENKTSLLLRHSIFMFFATQMANVANLLFQYVTGHQLPTEEYGVLATMMSIFLIASTPLDALRTAMAHFTTRSMRTDNIGGIRWIVISWSRRMFWLSIFLVAISYLLRHQAEDFFQLDSGLPFVFACCLIVSSFFLQLYAGVFQGMQNFYWMSVSMHVWTFVRLGLVIWFMTFSATALAGLSAHGFAMIFGFLLNVIGLIVLTKGHPSVRPATGIGGFFVRSLFMLGSYAVLMNGDLIFVKHYFSPEDAGVFARAATIARSVIFLPVPIAFVMFPKVITTGPSTRYSQITLLKAIGLVLLLVVGAVGTIIAMPWLPLRILYGIKNPDADMTYLLILFVCAMAPLALTFLLMNFEIAQHRFGKTWLLAACAAIYIGGVVLFHDTMEHVVWILAGVSLISVAGFVGSLVMQVIKGNPPHQEPVVSV